LAGSGQRRPDSNSIASDARFTETAVDSLSYSTGAEPRTVDDVPGLCSSWRARCALLLAGTGSQRGALEALADHLELRSVEFLGGVDPECMPMIYERADIFMNASEIDNMPLSILEANAAGLPVVSSDAGGIPWLVAHNKTGLLVQVGDYKALASQALRLITEDGLSLRLTDAARAGFERSYTWDVVQAMWSRVYADLALISSE
jgi:glycosyltransferase involved in cell wall biosynthesis